jgi:eukaryotic-like serine/threonine-protein kinase
MGLDVDPSTWKELNRLLDEALDLALDERDGWIEHLPPAYESLKPRLRALLSRAGGAQSEGLFGTLPKIEPDLTLGSAAATQTTGRSGDDLGPYRLDRLLAEGGMGRVWLAHRSDGLIERPVALKLPKGLESRPDLAQRIAREREILASLDHPHIARLYDAGVTVEGQPYLALEYVEGEPIDRFAKERGLDTRARLRLFLQVAEAVAHAHSRLVVHRDLKPSNILVNANGDARLLDFGIAKLLEEGEARETDLTKISGRALTLAYASPEQISGDPLGVASDVYSLGVVLYELLTETRPYHPARETRGALEEAVLQAIPEKPSEVAAAPESRQTLRGDLDTILLEALKKKPEERYSTVNEFADDVERYLKGLPVLAQPDRVLYRARKFVGRNRLGVAAAATVLAAIFGGTGVALWQTRVALAERERAFEVKEFIADIFRDANLDEGEGRSLTAVDFLDRAQARLDNKLEAGPAVKVELLNILGSSLMSLGETATAEKVSDREMALVGDSLDPRDPLAIRAHLVRSWVLMYRGKTRDARREIDLVFDALPRVANLGASDVVLAWRIRCGVSIDEGNHHEAELAGREAVRLAERSLSAHHPERLMALLELAYAHGENGDEDAARETAKRALDLAVDAHGDNPLHPSIIKARSLYGNYLAASGRLDPGIEQQERALNDAMSLFGPSSMTVGVYYQNLVSNQLKGGRVADALSSSEKALEICESYFEPDSYTRLSAEKSYGLALMAARRVDAALPAFTTAYETAVRTLGASHRITIDLRARRAVSLAYGGEIAVARTELEGALQQVRDAADASPFVPLYLRGIVERLAGEFAPALELQRRALDPERTARRGLTLVEIGRDQLELDLLEEASRSLSEARAILAELDDRTDPDDADVLVGLGRVRLARGESAEALPLLEEADAFWREFDSENRWAGESAFWLGRAYAALGRREESDRTLSRARKILARSRVPLDAKLLSMPDLGKGD